MVNMLNYKKLGGVKNMPDRLIKIYRYLNSLAIDEFITNYIGVDMIVRKSKECNDAMGLLSILIKSLRKFGSKKTDSIVLAVGKNCTEIIRDTNI
jgi:hypothetical protein